MAVALAAASGLLDDERDDDGDEPDADQHDDLDFDND